MLFRSILHQLKKIPQLIKERNQDKILGNKAIMISLMYTMFENAKRREEQEKYDMATLLWYRLLEMIEQRRLMTYQIYVSKPEYQKVDFSKALKEYADLNSQERVDLLKSRNLSFKRELFRSNDKDYLPNPIAL